MILTEDDSAAGWLLAAVEGEALVAEMRVALSSLMADEELYNRSSATARELFSKRFDLDITAGRYVRMLQELTPSRNASRPWQVESLVAC